jgi:hypothetical protein
MQPCTLKCCSSLAWAYKQQSSTIVARVPGDLLMTLVRLRVLLGGADEVERKQARAGTSVHQNMRKHAAEQAQGHAAELAQVRHSFLPLSLIISWVIAWL